MHRRIQPVADTGDFRRGGQFCVRASRQGVAGIETNHVGQHDSHCLAVHHTVMRRERVGGGVRRAEHAVFDRHSRQRGAQQHLPAGLDVLRFAQNPGQTGRCEFERFVGKH